MGVGEFTEENLAELVDEVELPHSDTEYDLAQPLDQYPTTLRVEGASSRADGNYRRLKQPLRGRAAYVRYGNEKQTYFFWKKKKWTFAIALQKAPALAFTKEIDDVFPLE